MLRRALSVELHALHTVRAAVLVRCPPVQHRQTNVAPHTSMVPEVGSGMSGIFGFWNLDGRPADSTLLAAMAATLAHRGPDGWSGRTLGPVAIGHRMLRVTPESRRESQPIVSSDGARILTADLRLDNRDELYRKLRLSPGERDISDADLLFRATEAYGAATPMHLLGACAWARWDEARRELVCARDHFGEKPLYYYFAPQRLFAFASEIKALWAVPGVPDDLDELEVARHLMVPVADDAGATYFAGIRRLLTGHTLTVTPTGMEERPYWSLDPTRSLALSSDDEYVEAVREVFIEAVRCRLRASTPIASMLSGGMDSSSITCVAARLLAGARCAFPLRTLSALYPDVPESDERRHIDTVLEMLEPFGVESSAFDADRTNPLADIDDINWSGDGANKAGNLYLNHTLYRMAAAHGARVVLDGFDGDSTLSHGQGRLREMAGARQWRPLWNELSAKARLLGMSRRVALSYMVRAYAIPEAMRRPVRRARKARTRWAGGLAPEFARAVAHRIAEPESPGTTDREYHRFLMTRPALLQGVDWLEAIGAGAGVEVRLPYFDVRLVELCVALPSAMKLRNGLSRFVMREAMAGILPDEIRWRRDKSFIEPGFHHALRTQSGEQIPMALAAAGDRMARYVDPVLSAELHERFLAGTASPDDRGRSWRMSTLALWLTGSRRVYTAPEQSLNGAEAPLPALVGSSAGG